FSRHDSILALSSFPTRRSSDLSFGTNVVHEHLDLTVYRGEILGVVGGSGTGKSVLLRAIVGLLQPKAGTVRLLGEDLLTLNDAKDRKSTRLNSSHVSISYAVFC